jgi:D-glycero-alpha-D-manno-heptose-7-phosphate kinase
MNQPETIRAQAPLRLSFAGGGTDFPHYFQYHGGAVLSATIDRFARAELVPRDDERVVLRSTDLGHRVEYHREDDPEFDGVLDLAKAAVARIGVHRGVELETGSDAPPGSGLGGSSALVTAVVGALAALGERSFTPHELAGLCYEIERVDLGIAGGMQDQYAAAFGGMNVIEFSASGVEVTPVRIGADALAALEERLLLCYTGRVRRDLHLIDEQIRMYREGREDTLLGMKGLYEAVYVMRDALEAGEIDRFGELLHEAYLSKKLMNPLVVEGAPIDVLYERARSLGAAGGKLCGAGGGGYLAIFCEPDRQAAVRHGLEELGGQFTDFALHHEGLRISRSAA